MNDALHTGEWFPEPRTTISPVVKWADSAPLSHEEKVLDELRAIRQLLENLVRK